MKQQIREMLTDAIECEYMFAQDVLEGEIHGLSLSDMRQYLEHIADQRLMMLGIDPMFGASNPFPFMELQEVQELTNFFERRVAAYQTAVDGEVAFNESF